MPSRFLIASDSTSNAPTITDKLCPMILQEYFGGLHIGRGIYYRNNASDTENKRMIAEITTMMALVTWG